MYKDWLRSFKNVHEYKNPIPLQSKYGLIPKTLSGTYYKCGPGVFTKFGTTVKHPFDGDGYVSAIRFLNGAVTYQARIVETEHFNKEYQSQKRMYSGAFGTKPAFRSIKNPANTSIIEWGSSNNRKLIVFCESGIPYVLDPLTLETIGPLPPFQEGLPVEFGISWADDIFRKSKMIGDAVSAHPKIIGDRLVFYTLTYHGTSTTITFYEMDDEFNVVDKMPFKTEGFLYLHDFLVTPTHYVFFHHPLRADMSMITHGIVNCLSSTTHENLIKSVPRPINPAPNSHVMETLSGFITHHAYLSWNPIDTSEIDIYSIMYDQNLDFQNMASIQAGSLFHTHWKMKSSEIKQRQVFDKWMEFPSSYGKGNIIATMSKRGNTNAQRCLVKAHMGDTHDEYEFWDAGPKSFISEPIYDNEGHILAVVYDSDSDTSTVAVFDSERVREGPVAEFWLPEPVPIGIHGTWSSS